MERGGKPLRKADLLGHVWLANFIFTRCPGPCATLSRTMADYQKRLAARPGVRLVSFTVDPGLLRYRQSRGGGKIVCRHRFSGGPALMELRDFPALNAALNSLATLLLIAGWIAIRRERKLTHIACMTAALVCSALFLGGYLWYHAHVGSVKFTGQGPVRLLYFTILLTHTVLAALVPFLVLATVIPALRARWDRHRRIARWTLPVWLYVSVTGVLVYLMLHVPPGLN